MRLRHELGVEPLLVSVLLAVAVRIIKLPCYGNRSVKLAEREDRDIYYAKYYGRGWEWSLGEKNKDNEIKIKNEK